MRYSRHVGALLAAAFSFQVHAQAIELDLIETDDLRLLYLDPFQTHLTPLVTQRYQTSLDFQRKVFDWTPYDKPTVVLQDFTDYGGGAALISPGNLVLLDIAPKNHTLETLPGSERFYMLMNHELVHVATMDGWNEQDRRWRRFFGGKPRQTDRHPLTILYNYLTVPRLSSPRWYGEGSAVFMETWMSGGIGRAQGGYDEMVFRAMVRDQTKFYSHLGLVSKGTGIDFQVGVNAYLYGTRFMSYMALQHSPEQMVEWLKRGEDSRRYFASQFEHVFGLPLEQAWDEWIQWEQGWQQDNLARIREFPVTPMTALADRGMGSVSRSFHDPGSDTLIGGFRYPGVVAHVGAMSMKTGEVRRLTEIKGPALYRVTSPAWDAETRTLFYTADNNAYRELMAVNVDTGQVRRLLEDARIGDLAFNRADRSLWGLRHLNGYVSLVRMPEPYDSWNEVHSWPYGTVPFDLDVSPDGQLISVSMGEIDGNQYLRLYGVEQLRSGAEPVPVAEVGFGTSIPEGFVFSPDGRYLFGSAYFTGVSNLFRYEIANRELEAVTNAETGLFRPIPREDGSLIAFAYSGDGFVPVLIEDPQPLEDVNAIVFLGSEIARQHPVVRDWVVRSPRDIDLDALITHRGHYRGRDEMGFAGWYPVIEGYRDSEALGWNVSFADPLQLNRFDITASYSIGDDVSSDEKLHVNVEYNTPNWKLRYYHNGADFYDLFGPTERSRKGDAWIVEYRRSLIYDLPRQMTLNWRSGYFTDLDTLPGNQNVAVGFEDILSHQVELDYTHTRKSLGAVDHEKGFRWHLVGSQRVAGGDGVSGARGGFDLGFALPWKHSSVWLYSAAGGLSGDLDNPLARYYFGGFGNNYVDDGEVKRYREFDSFPGFEIDELSGQTFAKTVLEWNLPPLRFEEAGTPGFYLSWLRPALFAGYLVTDPDEDFDRDYASVGLQIDLSFTVVHRLPMVLSIGYAKGFEDGDSRDDEWMLSIKVL